MTKRVQILAHDAETANGFIGLEREVTGDTDNWHLVFHDGSTPGGHRILNRDENDARYQARSVELDGLLGWEPNQRGILARQGPSNYDLISIEVNPENLTIAFADGFGGNPLISLADTITSTHIWSGSQQFDAVCDFNAGINGNVAGDLTGNVIGNVTGNVTGNLTGNANGDHTGTFTGVGTFTAITLPSGSVGPLALSDELNADLNLISTFVGMITMYSGDITLIPANWAVCDGANGTPDLRNRFVVAAGGTYAQDATGGVATHSHTITVDTGGAHSHTGTADDTSLTIAQLAAHSHGNGVVDNNADSIMCYGMKASPAGGDVDSLSNPHSTQGITETIGSGDPHNHTLTVDTGGDHTHTATTDSISNLPPYYALAFVMRIA